MLPAEAGSDLLACRVCLDVGGLLLPISGSGFEDIFGALTGVQLSMEGFPRHLCAFCRASLSKCISFRNSCQRSSALLQTLMEKGPLTMKDIETIDRKTNKLTNGMTREKVFHFLTHYFQIPPIKREEDDDDHVTPYEEIPNTVDEVYSELDQNFMINNRNSYKDNDPQMIIKKVKLEEENSMALSESEDDAVDASESHTTYTEIEIDKTEEELCQSDVNTNSDGETDLLKKTKSVPVKLDSKISTKTTKSRAGNTKISFKSKKRKKIGDDVYPLFDYEAFEEKFNVKIKFLSIDEQKQEIAEKKKANKSHFSCDICGKNFITEKTMKNHLSWHDPNTGPFECEICRCRFRAGAEVHLQRHRDTHRLSFACRDCGLVSRDKYNAKLHSLVHTGKTYTCQHCGRMYKHRTSYFTHLRERHPARNVACPQCGETFLSETGVRRHTAKMHGEDSKPKSDFKCPVCDVTFLSKEALDKHTADAGVPHAALWPCAACGESCGSEEALKHHAAEKHSNEQQYCDECGVTFASAKSFAQHTRRKHLGVTRHGARLNNGRVDCEVCGRSIQSAAALKFHMYTHMEQKPYACPLCPKTFAAKYAREIHMRAHTGERPYQCAECPLACALKATLALHIARVHLKQTRRFPCKICQKKFKERAAVKRHVRNVHGNGPARRVTNTCEVTGPFTVSSEHETDKPAKQVDGMCVPNPHWPRVGTTAPLRCYERRRVPNNEKKENTFIHNTGHSIVEEIKVVDPNSNSSARKNLTV